MISKSIVYGAREILYELIRSDLPIRRRLFRFFWRFQIIRKGVRRHRDRKNNAGYTPSGTSADIWKNGFKVSQLAPESLKILDMDKMSYVEDGSGVTYDSLDAVLQHENPGTGIYRCFKPHLSNPRLQEFANSEAISAVARDYLGDSAKLVDSASWITRPSGLTRSHFEFGFHRDIPDWKWLNVFIYLSDVTVENGPHGCIKGTHE